MSCAWDLTCLVPYNFRYWLPCFPWHDKVCSRKERGSIKTKGSTVQVGPCLEYSGTTMYVAV